MARLYCVLLLLLSTIGIAKSADTLYINRGRFVTIKQTSFPALAINSSPVYQPKSTLIQQTGSSDLNLVVINTDTATHGFIIKGLTSGILIPPGQSASVTSTQVPEGVYCFYDPLEYPTNAYLGASGMLAITNPYYRSFFWNIREYQSTLNEHLVQGESFSKTEYDPDYFTINGVSYPDIQSDTIARVWGSVGDHIRIYIANTGQSMHSLHFHGFHLNCISSTSTAIRTGWSKDTWAIHGMEGLVLELVVDKTGKYSVHDHNLVAVSAGGTHPNGMFTIMEFK